MFTTTDKAITVGAGAAITSPGWLPTLHAISATAAEWTPILGGIVLGLTGLLRCLQLIREFRRPL
jgi:hypothetical protein